MFENLDAEAELFWLLGRSLSCACATQDFFLTAKHRAQVKKEYGVESWHFEQHADEAVFIPAGCPHQVRLHNKFFPGWRW